MPPPPICPQCGTVIPEDARACPECGSDERTGWSEAGIESSLGLSESGFDYGEFAEREFGEGRRQRSRMRWGWALVAMALLAVFVWMALR
jgi:predicted nucleic acid-binding Zn ribbon protein